MAKFNQIIPVLAVGTALVAAPAAYAEETQIYSMQYMAVEDNDATFIQHSGVMVKGGDAEVEITIADNNEEETFGMVISDDELQTSRGASGIETLNVSIMKATSKNNSVGDNSVTGDNVISQGAFGNSQGVITSVQNSGNNVTIQSSTIVNMSIQ